MRKQIQGKVMKVQEGYCFIEPLEGADLGLKPGQGVFLHRSVNGGQLPAPGDQGVFQVERGERGWRVSQVVRWEGKQTRSQDAFINPYNFVPVPAEGLERAASLHPYQRGPAAPHDRYDPKLNSGWMDCVLTTRTWSFIPDPRKVEPQEHKTLGYFTLDPVKDWDPRSAESDSTRPAIPASSLRGMIRSIFETATLSCLPVFNGGALDYRLPADPGMVPESNRRQPEPSYLPVRVLERASDGTARLQLLDGRRPDERSTKPTVLSVALVHVYTPRVQGGTMTQAWRTLNLPDGAEVAAVIEPSPKRHHSGRFQFREAIPGQIVPADSASTLDPSQGWLIFGYLHRTGPNIENKHHERIFFHAEASWNRPGQSLEDRLRDFRSRPSDVLVAPAETLRAADQSLQAYTERHQKELDDAPAPPRAPNGVQLSDFIGNRRLEAGALCYALLADGKAVRGLYPVAIPRLTHQSTRGELLHPDFHACNDPEQLCAGCRVFGWVRPGDRQSKSEPGRVDAVAGHVRFTHGILAGDWGGEIRARAATLAILAEPKPTTTGFYLQPRPEFENARSHRWPPALQTQLHDGLPLYRKEEASLRGRKMYRHHRQVNPASDDPTAGGILSRGQGRQNQTVHLLPPNIAFRFRIAFDNLTAEELGALLFSVTLRASGAWDPGTPLWHALGHGKPLGLGACSIEIEAFQLDSFEPRSRNHRYAQTPDFGVQGAGNHPLDSLVKGFQAAHDRGEKLESGLRLVREALVELLRSDPPDVPIHYPALPGQVTEHYKWFVENRRPRASRDRGKGRGQRLPSPTEERDGETQLTRSPNEPLDRTRRRD